MTHFPKEPTVSWPWCSLTSLAIKILEHPARIRVWIESSSERRQTLASNLRSLSSELCLEWGGWDHSPYAPVSPSLARMMDRLTVLAHLKRDTQERITVICDPGSFAQPTIPAALFDEKSLKLQVNELFEREPFLAQLREIGYRKAESVEEPGQYSVRGDLVDIYPPGAEPIRVDFFDIEIESIRVFDPRNQRTLKSLGKASVILVPPASEVIFPFHNSEPALERIKDYADSQSVPRRTRDPIFENLRSGFAPENFTTWIPLLHGKPGLLLDHLPAEAIIGATQPQLAVNSVKHLRDELFKDFERYSHEPKISPLPGDLFSEDSRAESAIAKSLVQMSGASDAPDPQVAVDDEIPAVEVGEKFIKDAIEDGYLISIGCRSFTHRERISGLFGNKVKILNGDLSESVRRETRKELYIRESDLLGRRARESTKKTPSKASNFAVEDLIELRDLAQIEVGDTVVHTTHGVGRYLGLKHLSSGGLQGEYLLIEYAEQNKLYLPVYRLNSIHKYIGAGSSAPIDRLGSNLFERSKQKARAEVRKIAINLLELYAKRSLVQGTQFLGRGEEFAKFATDFEYTETEGQERAIDETLDDLESGKLMDRLVCGDVGFGKTEVAMRAAFQAVQNGSQVGVLVPTTLLAFQHEQSFRHRFRHFPIRIESLSRFKTKTEQKKILKESAEGKVDILIGTHRLLSKDVEWAKLGLLIVDEEHRFGVEHKEKIRSIQSSTHTLTLTATPIPRTLHMAMSGLKDITIMKSPPANRQAIATYVSGYSDELVRNAMQTELDRGGQVFYLYNKVQTIEARATELRRLLPGARILVAHGQLPEGEIESRMLDFYQGNAQVLLCTTIIESGIDVPRAGTIIVQRADLFGLSQLYQIRGRVGRGNKKAYAYLLVGDEGRLTDEARERLDVLQRFVELGSGFQIATYDLEMRGGGSLLGAEQSGHIAAVGLDLFMELLHEEVSALRGNPVRMEDLRWEPEIKVPFAAEIPESVIPLPQSRLLQYRRLSAARSLEAIDDLSSEFHDRYGDVPAPVKNLFAVTKLKFLLKKVGIDSCSIGKDHAVLTAREPNQIDPNLVMQKLSGPKGVRDNRLTLLPDSKLRIALVYLNTDELVTLLGKILATIAPKAFESMEASDNFKK